MNSTKLRGASTKGDFRENVLLQMVVNMLAQKNNRNGIDRIILSNKRPPFNRSENHQKGKA